MYVLSLLVFPLAFGVAAFTASLALSGDLGWVARAVWSKSVEVVCWTLNAIALINPWVYMMLAAVVLFAMGLAAVVG